MRVAIVWTHESHYLWGLARAIAGRGAEVLLATQGFDAGSPLQRDASGIKHRTTFEPNWQDDVLDFGPTVLVVAGWHVPDYVRLSRSLAGRTVRVMSMDNPWRGNARQRLGRIAFATKYRNAFDYALTPGPRQFSLARRLGFHEEQILTGGLPCNYELFQKCGGLLGNYFAYSGRVSEAKGCHLLLDAYRQYRASVRQPWDLTLCGTVLDGLGEQPPDGCTLTGFLQEDSLATIVGGCGAFIFPTLRDNWGVAVHEAAAAAKPILTTDACGAVGAMAQHGKNALVVRAGDVRSMAQAMQEISQAPTSRLFAMGRVSAKLAEASTPNKLASLLLQLPDRERILV